jgi:predicted ATPase
MKIRHLKVSGWRNFKDIELRIPDEARVVCLVGENGSGKSNLLELIGALAAAIGISPGIELHRGDPLSDAHSVQATFHLGIPLDTILTNPADVSWVHSNNIRWDGSITILSKRQVAAPPSRQVMDPRGRLVQQFAPTPTQGLVLTIHAGGCIDALSTQLANKIKTALQSLSSTHYLFLDADRSYPPLSFDNNEFVQALLRDWESKEWKRQRAYRPTRTLYTEWVEYCIATETQAGAEHLERERRAVANGTTRPEFNDAFATFKSSIQKVLPHLRFEGIDTQKRTLNFDTSGTRLKFTQLSGGEREIAFLIGQIDRFQLNQGLLLVDEPELHLNPDLIRSWIAFLRDTISRGQVWISTHSLEAVEVAGRTCSFFLKRNPESRLVESAANLQTHPILAELTAALGSPGFSISRKRFLFIEGERGKCERERFHRLIGDADTNRFMEAGGCRDVIRKVSTVREMSNSSDEPVRVGGVIDRDFRSPRELQSLSREPGIVLVPCHEIENLFLHLPTLEIVARNNGFSNSIADLIIESADKFAGGWIQQFAFARMSNSDELNKNIKATAWSYDWNKISADKIGFTAAVISAQQGQGPVTELQAALCDALASYETVRVASDLWKKCMGKQTMEPVAASLVQRNT